MKCWGLKYQRASKYRSKWHGIAYTAVFGGKAVCNGKKTSYMPEMYGRTSSARNYRKPGAAPSVLIPEKLLVPRQLPDADVPEIDRLALAL